jgi:hypothetical protein
MLTGKTQFWFAVKNAIMLVVLHLSQQWDPEEDLCDKKAKGSRGEPPKRLPPFDLCSFFFLVLNNLTVHENSIQV